MIATSELMTILGYVPDTYGAARRIAWTVKHRKDAVRRPSNISSVSRVFWTCALVMEIPRLKQNNLLEHIEHIESLLKVSMRYNGRHSGTYHFANIACSSLK